MAWLLCDGKAVASVEVVASFGGRVRGLLGRSEIEGAMLLTNTSSVHTFFMKFPIDVAFCDSSYRVIDVVSMKQHRAGRPRKGCKFVVEANYGAFDRWNLRKGSQLEVKD